MDMHNLELPKYNREQRENLAIRKVTDHCRCRIPGCYRKAQPFYHHIIQKSDILIDHKLNFIRLCAGDHIKADEFKISQVDLFDLVAEDNNITVEELLKELSEFVGAEIYIDGDKVKVQKLILQKRG